LNIWDTTTFKEQTENECVVLWTGNQRSFYTTYELLV